MLTGLAKWRGFCESKMHDILLNPVELIVTP